MNRVIIASFILLGLAVCFCIADCSAGRSKHLECVVIGHEYKPAWVETYSTTDSEGRTHIETTYHREEFWLVCQDQETMNEVNVQTRQFVYNSTTNNQEVTVETRIGRWTGIRWVPSISQ